MDFINIPIQFNEETMHLTRSLSMRDGINNDLELIKSKLDRLIDLIVFTPKGACSADADFGFEYWDYEYTNINIRDFNQELNTSVEKQHRQLCQESIKKSLENYQNYLKDIDVSIELREIGANSNLTGYKSRYEVIVSVSGMIQESFGISTNYQKLVSFYIEPTVKHGARI